MYSKKKIIFIGVFLSMLILLLIIYLALPKVIININGGKKITVNYGENYIDLGANAYYQNIFHSQNINLETTGSVDTQKIGKYNIIYKANYNNITVEKNRIVEVVDNEKPELTLQKAVQACKKNEVIEIDAIAIDNYDGNITDKINYRIDNDKVYISVSDSSNNTTEIIEQLTYMDEEKPTIKLKGSNEISLAVGENYIELGAEAYDTCDGDISSNIEINGTVNSNELGIYEIEYKVKDSVGNETAAKRTIHVVSNSDIVNHLVVNKATIYLTFDDGPGIYTEELLNILDNYNVKATFFVTNQFPKYQYLIKSEYEKGHTVGIHTYSHKWTIYKSVDDYLDDFNKIKNIVIEQTGITPKIFRFPGGSSNTVSRKYCSGIMTKLSNVMTDNGYIYYDWTFDSGDTSKTNNSKEAIINNVKRNLKGDGEYIILMHDIKKNTLAALPEIIEWAKGLGYSFNSLNENVNPPHFKIAN